MSSTLDAVERHADVVTAAQTVTVKKSRQYWSKVDPAHISESWREMLPDLSAVISTQQEGVAISAAEYGAEALAEQGTYSAPRAFVNTAKFAGVAADGRSLTGLLYTPAVTSKSLIAAGANPAAALSSGFKLFTNTLRTLIADTARQAQSADLASRTITGYTRAVVGETCPHCLILAGRFYRWNAGFKRHPGCDCVHVPTTKKLSEDLITDPYEHFFSLSAEQQDEIWGKENAAAIRDGADIYQVYNAYRSQNAGGKKWSSQLTTAEGTVRGQYAKRGTRLTPEGIYKQAATREDAVQLLEQYGYILPGGQTPGGVIRGDVIGVGGALGRGGTRIGQTAAFQEALRTGLRDADNVAAMTAAERRLYTATLDWQAVLEGRNPYGKTPLTPDIAARAEKLYRRWLRTGGQIY